MVKVIKNFVSPADAKTVVDFIEDNHKQSFKYNDDRKRFMLRFGYDEELPDQAIHSMYVVSSIRNVLIDIFKKTNKEVGYDVFLTSWFMSKQIPGAKLTPHKDGCDGLNEHLDYTAMLYLNSSADGGAIGFTESGIEIVPELGDLIIFKSQEDEHYVTDVLEDRYSLPMWFSKDQSKKFDTNR
jgi:hypothetical protein